MHWGSEGKMIRRTCIVLLGLVFGTAGFAAVAADLRLMSYNIGHAADSAGADLAFAVETICREKPDFVGLQDVDWHAVRSARRDQAKEIADRAGFHSAFAKASFIGGTPEQQHGVALLSYEKPKRKIEVDLPGDEGRILLICEYVDCYVGVAEFDPDPRYRTESRARVRKTVAELTRTKPVYLVDETGGLRPCEHRTSVVTVPDFDLGEPCVVPRPAEWMPTGGLFALRAKEIGLGHVKCRREAGIAAEGYRIEISSAGLAVTSSDDAGAFYAIQTLRQMATPRWGRLWLPCGRIADAPRFGWRGFMVDDSRHFFGKAAMKRTLQLMAGHKLNVLHWHLTDSEGWRLPVRAYPQLAEKGATRPYSTDHSELADRFEDGVYGPYAYSEADIGEIVAFARERHIRIVPEVDMPGHCRAALKAFPECLCFPGGRGGPKDCVDNVFCLGNPRSLEVMKAVFDAVCELFPESKVVHIGGDEVNKVNWNACPKCQAKMREIGAKDAEGLQSWLTRELTSCLAAKGRRIVGWDEIILNGQAPEGATVMSWRGAEGGIAAAKANRDCVMCPHRDCYFNYEQGLEDDPVVYPWWSYPLTLERAYRYDPLAGMSAEAGRRVLGGQCCLWANMICDEMQLQWQAWPRACATAEVFWSPASCRDYSDFIRRMEVHRKRLIDAHVNCAPLR